MKIAATKTNDCLFLIARFEQFKVCEFSTAVTESLNGLDFTQRISAGDAGVNRFYVLCRSGTSSGYVYRDGKLLGHVISSYFKDSIISAFARLSNDYPVNARTFSCLNA